MVFLRAEFRWPGRGFEGRTCRGDRTCRPVRAVAPTVVASGLSARRRRVNAVGLSISLSSKFLALSRGRNRPRGRHDRIGTTTQEVESACFSFCPDPCAHSLPRRRGRGNSVGTDGLSRTARSAAGLPCDIDEQGFGPLAGVLMRCGSGRMSMRSGNRNSTLLGSEKDRVRGRGSVASYRNQQERQGQRHVQQT